MKNIKLKTLALCLVLIVAMTGIVAINVSAAREPCTDPDCSGVYDVKGFCDGCGEYQPATLTEDKYDLNGDEAMDSVYEIENAGQLYWFAYYF